MEAAAKKRIRRTAEQRLADLEQKRLELLEKQKMALAKIEEEQRRLLDKRGNRKELQERQKRFERAVQVLAPDWDHRHFVAAVEMALSQANGEELASRGEALLEEHGKPRRGRRAKRG